MTTPSLPRQMMTVLDRLSQGEDFNQVVEQTGITARVYEAVACELPSASVSREADGDIAKMRRDVLPPHIIASALAAAGEACDLLRIHYYPSLEIMVESARGSRHWDQGEVFAWAESPERFVIFKQVAPASCEMFTVTEAGFLDVFTAYRFSADELLAKLAPKAPKPTLGGEPIGSVPSEEGSPLDACLRKLSSVLSGMTADVMRPKNVMQREAVATAQAMRTLINAVLDGEAAKTDSPQSLELQKRMLSDMVAPLGGNGLGDSVIWPALRRAAMHLDADAWTMVTNDVRKLRLDGLQAQNTVPWGIELAEIETKLESMGLRMESSLAALDEEGHAVVSISSGQSLGDDELTPEVIALATRWTEISERHTGTGAAASPGRPRERS